MTKKESFQRMHEPIYHSISSLPLAYFKSEKKTELCTTILWWVCLKQNCLCVCVCFFSHKIPRFVVWKASSREMQDRRRECWLNHWIQSCESGDLRAKNDRARDGVINCNFSRSISSVGCAGDSHYGYYGNSVRTMRPLSLSRQQFFL